jgi:hypothetical protein
MFMKSFLILTLLFSSFAITPLRADDNPLFAPRPTKDSKASEKHAQGAGIFEMIVDKHTGKVKGVFIRSSTKDVSLDADVINTFLQWRFKPNTESSIKVVVLFTGDKNEAFYPVGRKIHPPIVVSLRPSMIRLRLRNCGSGFLSVTVLRAIDETLEVLRQSSAASGRWQQFVAGSGRLFQSIT